MEAPNILNLDSSPFTIDQESGVTQPGKITNVAIVFKPFDENVHETSSMEEQKWYLNFWIEMTKYSMVGTCVVGLTFEILRKI